jgi:lysophospholipase L1-like esterase
MDFKIRELVKYSIAEYATRGPVNVVICGDSVSHGALNGTIDYDTVYHNRLRLMINKKWQNMPVNIINTAVGGKRAYYAHDNFERDVLPHKPDLVIICFGLNDVNAPMEDWHKHLGGLFDKCIAHGIECVYMTPNMLNTRVADDTPKQYWDYAHKTADMQNGGKMDAYMNEAREMAAERGIPVCDCYAEWKRMAAEGGDTTMMLANRINHPTREMHMLFAEKLFETIFGFPYTANGSGAESGMYQKNE